MSEGMSAIVRVTIGDGLTCSYPEGNVLSTTQGRIRFENFSDLEAEVRFDTAEPFRVTHDKAVVFAITELGSGGDHPFTVHEVINGQADDEVKDKGGIIIDPAAR